ncbi:MAG: hypothetical protein JWL83_2770 [Actinomycetia bacterium]|nr:hypothetical protein [Actinomycetes bacterium]
MSRWLDRIWGRMVVVFGMVCCVTALVVGSALPASAATAVGSPSMSVSSHSVGATQVNYTVKFVATTALTPASTIALTGPVGTVFAPTAGCSPYIVSNLTVHATNGCLSASASGNNAVITYGLNAAAGNTVSVTANAVTNASSTGVQNMVVSTSSDTTPVNLPFTLSASSAVTGGSVVLSSHAATATNVSYSVSFTATNAMTANYSTITLVAPAGTTFAPTNGCGPYRVQDDTTGGATGCLSAAVSGGGATVAVVMPVNAGVGDHVSIVANAVANRTTSGPGTLAFSTSSDPKLVALKFKLKGKTAVKFAGLHVTSTAATATAVTYSVRFTAVSGLTAGFSTITLAAPTGTTFSPISGCGPYRVSDDSTGQATSCLAALVSNGGATVTVTTPVSVGTGDLVSIDANAVSNKATAGANNVTFSTSSDPKTVALSSTLTAPTAVGSAGLTLTSNVHSATNVTYSVSFVATNALSAGFSTITLAAPAGTTFGPTSGCSPYFVSDVSTNLATSCLAAVVSNGGAMATITLPMDVGTGDIVNVTVTGVTNASGTGAQTLNVSTSSDPVAAGVPYSLT